MYSKIKTYLKHVGTAMQNRFRRRLKTRDAIAISIILHLIIGAAMASSFSGAFFVKPLEDLHSIEFDLVTEKTNTPFSGQFTDNSSSSESKGRAGNPAKSTMNRKAAVLASLASLSELRESFSFITQQVSSDSSAGFSPIQGKAPGIEFGFKNEDGFGNGTGPRVLISGGGVCIPGPRR